MSRCGRKKNGSGGVTLNWNRRPLPVPNVGKLTVAESHEDAECARHNLLIKGDNYDVMHTLIGEFRERIDLIYIDPPYATGRSFSRRTSPRKGEKPAVEEKAYDDVWAGGLEDYLQMIFERLTVMHELLSLTGSIYVHVDWHAAHYVRVILDEIFGAENFQNEIIWCYREAVNSKKRWNRKHDLMYFYSKGRKFTFNYKEAIEPHSEAALKKYRHSDNNGPYRLMGRGLKGSPIRSARDVAPEWEKNHPELTFRHYLTEGRLPVDYWNIDIVNQASKERTGYATQKPEVLLERIVRASSNTGDLVADFFCGSGTLPAVAHTIGRRWIACDSSAVAIDTARKRLLSMNPPAGFIEIVFE
jgi:adenine specific DNA methylase Mod